MTMLPDQPPQVLLESKFLRVVRHGHWEYVQRTNASSAVIVVPLTSDQQVVFIEQYRIPLQAAVIEFPAGMVGDTPETADESPLAAAQRELLEETGYLANTWKRGFTGACSAGLTDEVATFYLALDLQQVEAGGGVELEAITVHEVPLANVNEWLEEQAAKGRILDARLYSGLYLLQRELGLRA